MPQTDNTTDYFDLARQSNLAQSYKVAQGLTLVSENTFPHDVKCLRKDIGNLKILIDIFSYAYPATISRGDDSLLNFRKFLDEGYEIFGDFKDEFDKDPSFKLTLNPYKVSECEYQVPDQINSSIYSLDKVSKLRNKAQKWAHKYINNLQQIYDLLNAPSTEIVVREKSDLSRFYWGGLYVVPSEMLSGLDNIRLLQFENTKIALRDLSSLYSMETIHQYENEETFHDFRKRVRSLIRVDSFFPAGKNDQDKGKLSLKALDRIVGKFGDLNDLFLIYHDLKEAGHKKKAKELKETINTQWTYFKDYLKSQNLENRLIEVYSLYR
jgi:hypothetical protein